MNEIEKINRYDATVSELFSNSSSLLIPNNGPKRARIVIREILKKADKTLQIKTNKFQLNHELNGSRIDLWGWRPILTALDSFLLKGGQLKVLMCDTNNFNRGHAIFDLLQKYGKLSEAVRKVKGTEQESNSSDDGVYLSSLTVGDDTFFRQEIDNAPGNFSAVACANAPKKSKELSVSFNEEFDIGIAINRLCSDSALLCLLDIIISNRVE